MVSVSVRRNRREPVGRNAQPGDPRHNRAHPHPQNPGLFEQVDGWYDWAGRRLFLVDGSPDPMTPGAYRYQTRPDLTDLDAPDSDPWSPRYEPPNLRHKPGDTWIIDRNRPYDPDDSGPFGSDRWRPDTRTGRHRRDELPDPIPPWEQEETEETAAQDQGPTPQRSRGPALPIVPDRTAPSPRRRTRFWSEPEEQEGDQERAGSDVAHDDGLYRFGRLREDAWDRFLIKSAELSAAHYANRRALDSQHRWLTALILRLFRWLAAILKGVQVAAEPEPAATPQPPRPQPQPGPQPRRGSQLAQAVRGAQAARATRPEASCGADHWQRQPKQERPKRSPVPYMARWERVFDAGHGFSEAVAL